MSNKIWKLLLALSLVIVLIAAVNVLRLSGEYQKGINEYRALEEYVTITEEKTGEKESQIPVSVDVDFSELKAMNEDFIAWIYYEPLEISYPVVKGIDNDFYVKNTFEKEINSSGAIFMDFLNRTDFTDYNSIIYGHNMRNGTMFGSLQELLDDTSMIEENPYFYIFAEDKAYMYEIFAAYITDEASKTYDLIGDEAGQSDYISYINQNAGYRSEKELNNTDRIVTLSTCYGLHSRNRTVIHGVLIAQEDR